MKSDTIFVCSACGKQLVKWMGRCPGCGEWNTVVEEQAPTRRGPAAVVRADGQESGPITPLDRIEASKEPRLNTGLGELDRVLGGGVVASSAILLGGDPGIGKSTLLMQALGDLAASGERVLYVTGEESPQQIKLRADRLGIKGETFLTLAETRLETILDQIGSANASVLVLDSVQSVFGGGLESAPGGVSQVRHVAASVIDLVKRGTSACFLVGHVTKEGAIAGPKVLEHMVDTVLYFEGERNHPYRILRAVKNRFGSASEIGVFEMGDRGLTEVSNPSELFLSERPREVSGSTVSALMEGSRPILAEIQALVTGPVPGQGRRTCLGVDSQRLALMVAVLEKKLGLQLGDQDIFLNAVGGVRAIEPAVDLAVAAALLSSFLDRVARSDMLVLGEVGLAGEVRRVSRAEARILEAVRLGFKRIVAPASNQGPPSLPKGVTIRGISHITELGSILFDK